MWVEALEHARPGKLPVKVVLNATSEASSTDAASSSPAALGDWFTKKAEGIGAEKKRFFELRDMKVLYFADVENNVGVVQKGDIQLTKGETRISGENRVLLIINNDRTWHLTADAPDIVERWVRVLTPLCADLAREDPSSEAVSQPSTPAKVAPSATVSTATPATSGVAATPSKLDTSVASVPSTPSGPSTTLTSVAPTPAGGSTTLPATPSSVIASSSAASNPAGGQPEDEDDGASTLAAAKEVDPDARSPPLSSAWFLKKAEKLGKAQRRFFELHMGEILYYAKEKDGFGVDLKGRIAITEKTTLKRNGANLDIVNPDRTWRLIADTPDEAEGWESLIPVAQGVPEPPKAEAFTTAAHSSHRTTPLAKETLAAAPAGGKLTSSTSVASLNVDASSGGKDLNAMPTKNGWLKKKAEGFGKTQERFFMLHGVSINYFVNEKDGLGVDKKGTISLIKGSKVQSNGREVLLFTPARVWHLEAETPDEAQKWQIAIAAAIDFSASQSIMQVHDSSGDESSSDEENVEMIPHKGVWLYKKGEGLGRITGAKRRYFQLVYGISTRKLKLNYYANIVQGIPSARKGHINIFPNSPIVSKGKAIEIVS